MFWKVLNFAAELPITFDAKRPMHHLGQTQFRRDSRIKSTRRKVNCNGYACERWCLRAQTQLGLMLSSACADQRYTWDSVVRDDRPSLETTSVLERYVLDGAGQFKAGGCRRVS